MNLIAHPTRYGGVLYRSRLEAKWAAFFDLLSWPHAYEPFDLKGYIPDFILTFPHAPVLVEVKPELYLKDLEQHGAKIKLSGWDKEILIVGAALFSEYPDEHRRTTIGIVGERNDPVENEDGTIGYTNWSGMVEEELYFVPAHLILCSGLHYSFNSWTGDWACRYCGGHPKAEGEKRVAMDDVPIPDATELWNPAGEKTRWRPGS